MEPPNLQQILVLLPKYVYLKSHKSFMSFLAIQLHHSPSQNMNTTIYVVGPYSKSTGTFSLLRIIIFCNIFAVDRRVGAGSNKDKARWMRGVLFDHYSARASPASHFIPRQISEALLPVVRFEDLYFFFTLYISAFKAKGLFT